MENYYEQILKQIQELVEKHDFDNALSLITDELNAPYVPMDFEQQLKEYNNQLLEQLNINSNHSNLDLDKITQLISKKMDQEIHLIAFDALRNFNARKIIEPLKEYFLSTDINNEYKTFLLMVLIEQSIDENLTINLKDKTYTINPSKIDLNKGQQFLKEIELKLENLVFDSNPSLFNICCSILNTYFYSNFLGIQENQINQNDLTVAIIKKALLALDIEELQLDLENKINFNYNNTMLLLEEINNFI